MKLLGCREAIGVTNERTLRAILVLSWWQFFPFPGLLRDKLGSYDVAFYLAGIPPIIGGVVLCFIPWLHIKKQREISKTAGEEKMEKMLENQNSLLSSSSGIFKKESDSVI